MICHDRATRRSVLNLSVSVTSLAVRDLTQPEDDCRQNGGGPTISQRWRRYAALTSSEANDS